jgi:predicted transcriptional regulator
MEHQNCPNCGQSITYELAIDKGSCDILKALAREIGKKKMNVIHPSKEMAKPGIISARQLDNLVRLKFNGLVAHIDGERGNYCITNKGFDFLSGEPISKAVTIKKRTKEQRAHVIAHSDDLVVISDFDGEWKDYWSANGYTIVEGRVITELPIRKQATLL